MPISSSVRVIIGLLLATVPAVTLLTAVPALAGDNVGYDCQFVDGTTHSYENGAFVRADVKPLGFRIVNVRPQAETARLETGNGSSSLKVVQALGARHFIEVAVEGYLVITTIYEAKDASGAFAAVHSRHLAVIGEPFVAQYRGSCTALP